MKFFFALFFFVCGYSTLAQTIVWDGKTSHLPIGEKVFFLEDKDKGLAIEQISSDTFASRFRPLQQKILNFETASSAYWIKFLLQNKTGDSLLLEAAQAKLPYADLYYKDPAGRWLVYHAGYKTGLTQKPVQHHYQLFPLPNYSSEYYLRIEQKGTPVPLSIWNKNVYETKITNQKIIYGIYMGIMLFVILNNIFLFFSLGRSGYLHYALLVTLYASFSALSDGYILYLFPNMDVMYWYTLNPIVNQPNGLLYCLFFLEVKKYQPRLHRFSLAVFFYFLSYIAWHNLLPPETVDHLSKLHALIGILLMATIGICVGIKGNKLGYYFSLTYFTFFAIACVEVAYQLTGKPGYFFELSHISLGIFFEVFMLMFLLSKRFEWEKADIVKARFAAQHELMEKISENEKIVKEQNLLLEQKVTERTSQLNEANTGLKNALESLKESQLQLIQQEKLASLGILTSGIAHEIQNPLNFVNNFSELNRELITELQEEQKKAPRNLEHEDEILKDLDQNLDKINFHGKRADAIVKGMLMHSRSSTGQKENTDINALADEYLRLSFHGLRAKDKSFNAKLETDYDTGIGKINIVPQDIGRVILNLFTNSFYAVTEKNKLQLPGYEPCVSVTTKKTGKLVMIIVRDNGMGIPRQIVDKIYQPFFTTKPTGHGTGLGLSLSYDIIKAHGGELKVNTKEGEFAEFTISLPY